MSKGRKAPVYVHVSNDDQGWCYDVDLAPKDQKLDAAMRVLVDGEPQDLIICAFRTPTLLAAWRQLFESGVQREPVGKIYAWRHREPPPFYKPAPEMDQE